MPRVLKCQTCKKDFTAIRNFSVRKFCSFSCYQKSDSAKVSGKHLLRCFCGRVYKEKCNNKHISKVITENKKCVYCGKVFWKRKTEGAQYWENRKVCSHSCSIKYEYKTGKRNQIGEHNSNWKGDDVKYEGIHAWVKTYFPKTKLCMQCGLKPPRDLANKSGNYSRMLSDWEWLCRKCHMVKDGRLENLIQRNKTYKVDVSGRERDFKGRFVGAKG